ncbi:hypothetical protein ISF_07810 [Cordyceps fumosorosea ARSEF 2679]|uniref:F-box domain-containing protein n=1 Tax=Cordyceps fumosorosea (strain ARSEF 2679) TaxID=1081104 RepID=A0A162IDR0_CORFA|nr:hypothetical protein ISF_07810 [Cordyceps fumosorosea ARSEF 2679]OAA55705.1 hypothetical protein ISF_07810 [Cordyceps fumosorosea ARSEF 2679]
MKTTPGSNPQCDTASKPETKSEVTPESNLNANTEEPVLLRMPSEILTAICRHLLNKDIKAFRLACPTICHAIPPRFTRVFLSPNPRNLEVFRAVAAHPTFRLGVREIVVDDARLADPTQLWDRQNDGSSDETPIHGGSDTEDATNTAWFNRRCARNLKELRNRNVNDTENLVARAARAEEREAQSPLEKCQQHYDALLCQQFEVMAAGEDARALVEGLDAFPALERITVTPSTHGYLYTSLYRTPMIRNFPRGFNYPIPRGWPTYKGATMMHPLNRWTTRMGWTADDVSREKAHWRALVLVLETLAARVLNGGKAVVPELVFDVHALNTGISPYMLTDDCDEYENLALLLRQPGFRRLDLPILVTGTPPDEVSLLENGRLKSLLAGARHLQHFRLRFDGHAYEEVPFSRRFFPLQKLLPLKSWDQLRHFGLSNAVVRIADLVDALVALPATLRSVELSFLKFERRSDEDVRGETHAMLLERIKARVAEAAWAANQPRVTLGMAKVRANVTGRGLWLSKEIGDYLYGFGRNPFGTHEDILLPGMGWLADEYDPEFERPYKAYKDYRALWYGEG